MGMKLLKLSAEKVKTPLKLFLFQLPNQQLILNQKKKSKRRRETRKTRRKRKRKKQRNPIAIVIEKFLLLDQSKIDIIIFHAEINQLFEIFSKLSNHLIN